MEEKVAEFEELTPTNVERRVVRTIVRKVQPSTTVSLKFVYHFTVIILYYRKWLSMTQILIPGLQRLISVDGMK